ncbi:hypothetical protein ACFQ3F_01545 [Nocardioides ginsengisoli]|uniref:Secreted protein n=1 Tax=Nocardioides ginsengisoli TaxID=363868 RepID=A0ABW3VUM7_9ACTN
MFRSPRDVVALLLSVVVAAGMLEWQWGLISCLFGSARADDVSFVTVIDDDPEPEAADLGERQSLGGSLSVTVSDARVGGETGRAWLTVRVRTANDRSRTAPAPQITLNCGESGDIGLARGEENGLRRKPPVAAGTTTDEEVDLLLPGDAGYSSAGVRDCAMPAFLQAAVYAAEDSDAPSPPRSGRCPTSSSPSSTSVDRGTSRRRPDRRTCGSRTGRTPGSRRTSTATATPWPSCAASLPARCSGRWAQCDSAPATSPTARCGSSWTG